MPKYLSRRELETAEIVALRNRKRGTVAPTQRSCVTENVTLATPKATVTRIVPKGRDLSWLMADVLSTPSGYRS